MGIDKIYFDMDGVIADFNRGVYELTDYNGLIDKDQKNSDEMYEKIRKVPNYYFKLKPFDDAIDLLKNLYKIYGDKVEILTGIPKPKRQMVTASEDKILWVKKYIGDHIKVNTVYKEEKKNFCKGKSSILIDDLAANINDWKENGGTGILHTDTGSTKEILKKLEIIK